MEIDNTILNVDHIIAASPTEYRDAAGHRYHGTQVVTLTRDAPLILQVEFVDFRQRLDRLLNLRVTEGETIRHDHHAR